MPEKLETRDDLVNVEEASVSLSQAILAPLDALFKAQIHSARSFLNFLLQIGYPHQKGGDGKLPENDNNDLISTNNSSPNEAFQLTFKHSITDPTTNENKDYIISIPALALVPVNALSIDSGEFKFGLSIKKVGDHEQLQSSRSDEKDNSTQRPWNLVSNPLSMVGTISSSSSSREVQQSEATIDIHIKVSKSPIPAALDNLLTTLSQNSKITEVPKS